jgi:hypothetical protein
VDDGATLRRLWDHEYVPEVTSILSVVVADVESNLSKFRSTRSRRSFARGRRSGLVPLDSEVGDSVEARPTLGQTWDVFQEAAKEHCDDIWNSWGIQYCETKNDERGGI